MKITLKDLKINKALSQETTCFSATVYADDAKVGTAANRGCGGSNEYYWTNPDLGKKLEAWAQLQHTEYDFEKLDQLIDKQIDLVQVVKQFKTWCKKKTVFRLASDKKDQWNIINSPFTPKVKDFLAAKYGDTIECIINEDIEKAAANYA